MPPSSLAASSLNKLINQLKDNGSSPKADHKIALEVLLETLEAGLSDNLSQHYFLSAIDPGIGKSLAVSKFLQVWKERNFTPASSVLIGLSRLQEIEGYLKNSGLNKEDVAVLTSDHTYNELGVPKEDHPSARVMFTTQQMIERRTRDKSFADAEEFHFEGEPRSLRIWDESLIPAAHLVVHADEIAALPLVLRKAFPQLADTAHHLNGRIYSSEAGQRLTIPAEFGELPDGIRSIRNAKAIETLEALSRLAGQELEPVAIGDGIAELAGAATPLPEDFAPVVILDASGRVRSTYRVWEQTGGPLRRLPEVTKDYGNLRVYLWERRVGKAPLKLPGTVEEVVTAISDLIEEDRTDDQWLIISYKEPSIERQVREALRSDVNTRMHFLTWGMHHGTNEFKDCRKVVLVGQMSYGAGGYRALASACGASDPDKATLAELERGEYRHHLLQALTRASVRYNRHGQSGTCTAYIIASPNLGIHDAIAQAFPGCAVERWCPDEKDLGGKVGKLIKLLQSARNQGMRRITKKELRDALGIAAPNFSRLLGHREVTSWLDQNQVRVGQRELILRPTFEPWPGEGSTIDPLDENLD